MNIKFNKDSFYSCINNLGREFNNVFPYYLSENNDKYFNEKLVGLNTSGKFIVEKISNTPTVLEIMSLTSYELIVRNTKTGILISYKAIKKASNNSMPANKE
jgi:hypothetical protein